MKITSVRVQWEALIRQNEQIKLCELILISECKENYNKKAKKKDLKQVYVYANTVIAWRVDDKCISEGNIWDAERRRNSEKLKHK